MTSSNIRHPVIRWNLVLRPRLDKNRQMAFFVQNGHSETFEADLHISRICHQNFDFSDPIRRDAVQTQKRWSPSFDKKIRTRSPDLKNGVNLWRTGTITHSARVMSHDHSAKFCFEFTTHSGMCKSPEWAKLVKMTFSWNFAEGPSRDCARMGWSRSNFVV